MLASKYGPCPSFLLHHKAEPLLLHIPRFILHSQQFNGIDFFKRNVLSLLVFFKFLAIVFEIELTVDFVLFDCANVAVH
jgi:hypothetical protein